MAQRKGERGLAGGEAEGSGEEVDAGLPLAAVGASVGVGDGLILYQGLQELPLLAPLIAPHLKYFGEVGAKLVDEVEFGGEDVVVGYLHRLLHLPVDDPQPRQLQSAPGQRSTVQAF